MGKLIPNPAAGMIEGKVGELVYVRLADGSVVVRRRPVRQAPWTVKQVGTQVRFRV